MNNRLWYTEKSNKENLPSFKNPSPPVDLQHTIMLKYSIIIDFIENPNSESHTNPINPITKNYY